MGWFERLRQVMLQALPGSGLQETRNSRKHAAFPHLPPHVSLSDPRQLRLCADLPAILEGQMPPDRCPHCGSAEIAPEDSGMDFPEGTVVYACSGAYMPSDREEGEGPHAWEAFPSCWNLSDARALELLIPYCNRPSGLTLGGHMRVGQELKSVPGPALSGIAMGLMLQDWQARHRPETCPICDSGQVHEEDSFSRYECGAIFTATCWAPDAQGKYIPIEWTGELPCRSPTLRQLLTLLGTRLPAGSAAANACANATASLPGADA